MNLPKKSKENALEHLLMNFRFVTVFVVIALLFASLLAMLTGFVSTYKAANAVIAFSTGQADSSTMLVYLISSLDEFLLGVVLFIIAIGIYELFIGEIELIEKGEHAFLEWLRVHTLDDLKGMLTKVIVIILMVYFFKSVIILKFNSAVEVLLLSCAILLLAIANYLGKPHK